MTLRHVKQSNFVECTNISDKLATSISYPEDGGSRCLRKVTVIYEITQLRITGGRNLNTGTIIPVRLVKTCMIQLFGPKMHHFSGASSQYLSSFKAETELQSLHSFLNENARTVS
jgi:hypothetical protein